MIAAYSLLALIGLSDLLHSRELSFPNPPNANPTLLPEGRWRRVVLIAAAALVTAAVAFSSPWWALVGLLAGMALWLLSYRVPTQAFGMVATAVITFGLLTPSILIRLSPPDWGPTWGHGLSVWQVSEWGLLILAVVLINLATANRVVRMVLRFANATSPSTAHEPSREPASTAEAAPRAGRVIGVLERFLLIALIAAGQGLAIAGVAAAKSIIRYPEISQTARNGEGLSAEVFFIGTVTSWLFALASAGLIFLAIR